MKKNTSRIMAFGMSLILLAAFAGSSFAAETPEAAGTELQETAEELPESAFTQGSEEQAPEGIGIFRNRDEEETTAADTPEQTETDPARQLTEDDIIAMNNGDYTMLFSEEGYLTFLRGRYYDGKVTNEEEGIESLFGIQQLLGLSKGSEFFAVFGSRNAQGYTFYTYQQRYGDTTLQNAVLKIIVDPDGYTAGLVSSFLPNVGIAPEEEDSITPEEAELIVLDQFPDTELRFYSEDTRQTSVTFDGVAVHCWAVFTDIPVEGGMIGDRRYLEHLVSYSGVYYGYTAVVSTTELKHGDDLPVAVALNWFEGKTADTYTATVTCCDGTQKELTVPVVKDEATGTYYLADLKRHILVADYYSFEYEGLLIPWSSEDNTGWPEHYLLTYESYIKVYDFYDRFGMTSVDGFGMPILILTDCCEYDGMPIDNAFFAGFDRGWAKFGASAVNDYGECIDVIGHEFTHGITSYTLAGDLYENETGAVNEALSDIMGNICEMLLNETEDTTWLIAENRGLPLRSMSFPWLYKQPVQIGGTFFQSMDEEPSTYNDLGGVHTNSSLVNYIAWQLWAEGLPLQDCYYLWRETINLLTPLSGFREIHHALLFAAEMLDMDVVWYGMIEMLCEQAGY